MLRIFNFFSQKRISKVNKFINNYHDLIFILITYILLGLILLPHYQYIINADGFSYITIAQKYAHGDWGNAINGAWSPLFSWLLSIFLIYNSSPEYSVYAFKILSLLVGISTLLGIYLLSLRFEIEKNIRNLVIIFSIPMMLFISLEKSTPDLLSLSFILYYLFIIFDPDYSDNFSKIILCGALGALAYFTKSYIFLFFPLHFISINLYNYLKIHKDKFKLYKTLFIGLLTFFVISTLWIGLISDKYGYTVSTASEYNHDLVGPNSQWHPMIYQGLFEPPNKSALSAWEDLSYIKTEPWSPIGSWDLLIYQIKIIYDNLMNYLLYITLFSSLSVPILIISIHKYIKDLKNQKSNTLIFYSLSTIIIYSIGFLPIYFEYRYILIDFVLLFLLGAYLISLIQHKRKILIIIMVLSFVIFPSLYLSDGYNENNDLFYVTQTLNESGLKGNMASTAGFIGWEESHFISFYLNNQYYGGIDEINYDILKKYNIKYYIAWSYDINDIKLPLKEIASGKINSWNKIKYFKIYSID